MIQSPIAMNRTELGEMLEELKENCIGGWVQKIHQPLPNTLIFDIRVPGQSLTLLTCVDPQFARIHFASKKLDNPPTPPSFCQFLRAHLEGGRIEHISQEPQDRVIYIGVGTASSKYILVVALTGNQSNAYLLNHSRQVMQTLRLSRLKAGDRYAPPIQDRQKLSPLPTPPLLRGEGFKDIKTEDQFTQQFPVSAAIEERYWKKEQDQIQAQARTAQLSQIKKALKHAKKKITGLQEDLQKAQKFQEYGRYGELLKGQLHAIHKGQESVTLVDYYDPALPQLTLLLDSSKDPVWNMEDYFRKHHKFLSAEKHLRPRLETVKQEAERLQQALTHIESGEDLPLEGVARPSQEKGTRDPMSREKPMKPQASRPRGYRQYVSSDELMLLVGKTAKDNDVLTFKVAGPDDLWLHARGTPGSHVVIRLEKGADPPHESLKDAATLALWFSDLRKSGKGEVIYTRRKFVKKAKGQKAGSVTVSREKTIWIEVKDERLERLKRNLK